MFNCNIVGVIPACTSDDFQVELGGNEVVTSFRIISTLFHGVWLAPCENIGSSGDAECSPDGMHRPLLIKEINISKFT